MKCLKTESIYLVNKINTFILPYKKLEYGNVRCRANWCGANISEDSYSFELGNNKQQPMLDFYPEIFDMQFVCIGP